MDKMPDLFGVAGHVGLAVTDKGEHLIRITLQDGRVLGLTMPAEVSARMLREMQDALIRNAGPGRMPVPIPLGVEGAMLGHGEYSAVMVSTDRMGWVALGGTPERMRQLRDEIDRLLPDLEARKTKQ